MVRSMIKLICSDVDGTIVPDGSKDINPEYFEMTVNGVQQQSCEMILEDYITSSWIMVNNSLYENTTSICNAEENDMTFVYSNNLGERRTCSQKGLFNVASYKTLIEISSRNEYTR